MAFTCNIEQRGRRFRAILGFLLLLAAVAVVFLVPPGLVQRALIGALVLGGLFCFFEAVMGWCGVRAMGIRTRI